ncbi:hypothetical protein Lal_00009831 [Lupinus albus]|nr:hypothetical protein Lal_00009831 [Lupinus albus]
MEAFLDDNDIWEAIEQDYVIPTIAQLKQRKSIGRVCLYAVVSPIIFNRIMTIKTTCEIWNFLKQIMREVKGSKGCKMRNSETIKEYSDKLLAIINNVRLIGTKFYDSRIVQKIIVILPEKYEVAISSLEMSKNKSSITLVEVLNALQAQE